jgi:MORN variant repeat protein
MRISYYENGKIKIIGKWENDVPVGKGQVYDEEGNVIAETIYENGEVKILEK